MPLELQTAFISATVAIITAAFAGYLTWNQIQRERQRWLIDLKAGYSLELYKLRLTSYPKVFEILIEISHHEHTLITPEIAKQVAHKLNEWYYSTGGACAESSTRGAIRGLRDSCTKWGEQGTKPPDLYMWRDTAMVLLRRDLDLRGLDTFEFGEGQALLKKLRAEVDQMN
jgi:hypothetical protein